MRTHGPWWLLIVLVTLSMPGCSGCTDPYGIERANRAAKELEEKEAKERKDEPPPAAASAAAKPVDKKGALAAAAAKPLPPGLPQNFSQWKREDYLRARREDQNRLFSAVQYLGAQAPDRSQAVAILLELLQGRPPVTGAGAAGNPAASMPPLDGKLEQAIVAALVANKTEPAWQMVRQIALGNVVVQDKASQETAIRAMAENISEANEQVLYQLLTARDVGLSQGSAAPSPGSSEAVLAAAASGASEQFRVRLAEHLVNPATPRQKLAQLGRVLLAPSPRNLGAQLVLCRGFEIDPQVRGGIQQFATACGSESLRRLLGVPPDPATSAAQTGVSGAGATYDLSTNAELPACVARTVWSDEVVGYIAESLQRSESLEKDAAIVRLASTMPFHRVRAALSEVLWQSALGGPKALQVSQAWPVPRAIRDPGFVVVVKQIASELDDTNRSAPRAGKALRSRKTAPKDVPQRPAEKAGEEWLAFSRGLVQGLCAELHRAAQARSAARVKMVSENEEEASAGRLPLKLHDGANVVAEYHAAWPDPLQSWLPSSVDPVKVHYLRFQETADRVKKILGHYRRQIDSPAEHQLPTGNGLWLEAWRAGEESNAGVSYDVILQRPGQSASAPPDPRDKIIIEVLVIEMLDPRKAPQTATQTE